MNTLKNERIYRLYHNLTKLGFSLSEIAKLLSISRQLSKWDTDLCNGDVSIDDERNAYRQYGSATHHPMQTVLVANRGAQALKRLNGLMSSHPRLLAYHQSDPRGCALYIIRKADVKGRDVNQVYSTMGIAVCL